MTLLLKIPDIFAAAIKAFAIINRKIITAFFFMLSAIF